MINLTQHSASSDQVLSGVVDLPEKEKSILVSLLTVDSLPTRQEIESRCHEIGKLAISYNPSATRAMIGGAPWMMSSLESALSAVGITPVYAFSIRESVDQHQPDGSVRKIAVFRHVGFV